MLDRYNMTHLYENYITQNADAFGSTYVQNTQNYSFIVIQNDNDNRLFQYRVDVVSLMEKYVEYINEVLLVKYQKIMEENEKLREQLKIVPGGELYLEAQARFNEFQDQIKN